MRTDNYGKKIYMVIFFAMIFMLSIFKMIYIRREYPDLCTDYSAYILIFMPFLIYCALKYTGDISSAVSLNWLCVIPMSLYVYQSRYLYFKQFDVLLVYSLMGIFVNLVVFKKAGAGEFVLAVSGYIMLNVLTLAGVVKELVLGINGDNYEQYCVINILKNSNLFSASQNSGQYLDMLFSLPGKRKKLYFIAEKITQYGTVKVISVFVLLITLFMFLFFRNYKKNNEISLIAAAILIMQSVCFLFVNFGILRGSVYEFPLLKKNMVYSFCQLVLLCIASNVGGYICSIVRRLCYMIPKRNVCKNEK